KGLGERAVVIGHALRNALIPTVTVIGLQFGYMLGGAVLTEVVFAWPGLGRYLVQSIFNRDYPAVQGAVLLIAACYVVLNLQVDLSVATEPPSPAHLFGTDEVGRDILTRVLYGGRTTLLTAVIAVLLSLVLGVPIGLIAGYARGWVDQALMRAMDLLLAFPSL